MIETETHEGGCLCGNIRYRISAEPLNSCNCHCGQCRMAAGAPFIPWVEFPVHRVTFTTEPPRLYKSSDIAERGYCPACGTALTFHLLESDSIEIAAVTFDDPEAFPPQAHIWTDSKMSWLKIDDGLPQYPRERGSK